MSTDCQNLYNLQLAHYNACPIMQQNGPPPTQPSECQYNPGGGPSYNQIYNANTQQAPAPVVNSSNSVY
jgi:hypothetical protein